ncbi:type II toxin-antitoxin system Phd/YefM family antitoxin [Blastococcus sp. PRF04-17]|uniref:type II toxin-antitoxin system Phd/YefM family antitoxin n=1 Tax=Blastococcus sp. PRF04-17 TaxID=2933797 RepID=UPI00353026BE
MVKGSRQHERVHVMVHGKPSAVLVATEDLESLEETIDILVDADTIRRLHASGAELALAKPRRARIWRRPGVTEPRPDVTEQPAPYILAITRTAAASSPRTCRRQSPQPRTRFITRGSCWTTGTASASSCFPTTGPAQRAPRHLPGHPPRRRRHPTAMAVDVAQRGNAYRPGRSPPVAAPPDARGRVGRHPETCPQ